jgi:cyclohexa-1,5-dienecarbonyl-CoA hydratase
VSGALVRLAPGPVARVTLDRPPVNVLNIAMLEELGDAVTEASTDLATKVLLLEGAGKAFCAGVDVHDHTADRVEAMIDAFARTIAALRSSPVPVVAAIHGAALGGGCELALACDIVLARDDACSASPRSGSASSRPPPRRSSPPGRPPARSGPPAHRPYHPRRRGAPPGPGRAVLPAGRVRRGGRGLPAQLAAHSRPVLALTKRAVVENLERPVAEALHAADRLYLSDLMVLHDPHEGLAAFMEKRDPVWNDS